MTLGCSRFCPSAPMPNGREKKRNGCCCKQQVVACSQVGGVGSVLAGLIRMLGQRLRSIPQMRTIREAPSGAKHVQVFVPFASAQQRQSLQNMGSAFDQGTGSTKEPQNPPFGTTDGSGATDARMLLGVTRSGFH